MATGEKISIVLHSTDQSGKRLSTSITSINPDATDMQLLNLATMLNQSLTSNTYVQTNKISNYILDVQQGE